jgi:uncharacterized membrane protein YbhN (UPF0104 family)
LRALTPLLPIALFGGAVWALSRELHELSLGAVIRSVQSYDATHLLLALLCTTASFLALGAMELLALHYVGRSRAIPRSTAIATAFVANAFSQSVGLALLTGAAVRLRVYGRRAIDAVTVARMSGFATLTVVLGLLATGATALVASSVPLHIGSAVVPVKPLGTLLALVVLSYLAWSAMGREPDTGRLRHFDRPSVGIASAQILLASLDWLLTGTVLFALLSPSDTLSYVELLRIYLTAQTVAVASHVPGGAGVFELMVLALRPVDAPTARVLFVAALLLFRFVYYVVPLVVATIMAAVAELTTRRTGAAPVVAAPR